MEFDWDQCGLHVDALRAMGCAVITITPEDVQSLFDDPEDPDPLGNIEQATEWLRLNHDDVEGAILTDYWGDNIRDVVRWKRLNEEQEDRDGAAISV